MDEEQHYDAFNVDNDFEGLVEVGGEFMYRSKRQKRMQTRDEQLYGYQSSDEDDDEGFGGRRGKRGKKADYSKPVGFVSSGVMVQQQDGTTQEQPKQPDQQQQQQQQQRSSSADTAGDAAAGGGAGLGFGGGAGLGFGGAGAGAGLGFSSGGPGLGSSTGGLGFTAGGSTGGSGLGFKSGGVQQGSAAGAGTTANGMSRHQQQQQQEDEADEDEAAVLPTAFGKRIKAAVEQKQKQKQAAHQAAAQRSAARAANPNLGSFEAHTKGIGAKLLQKMNWTPGQGLGRNKQGIAKPLEAKLRPKGMGMGFGDYQETKLEVKAPAQKAAADAAATELEGELAAAAAKLQAPLWKKKAAPVRQKRLYKTAEEVLEEAACGGPAGGVKAAAQPILDLRGPQARLVTDLEQLNATADGAAAADAGPPMPELAHNMGLLVSLTEAQLRRMDASLQHQQDTATLLAQEKERLAKEVAAAAAASDRLAGLTARLVKTRQADTSMGLEQLAQAYSSMAQAYPEEYVMYSLAAAALAQVLPRMRGLMTGWQPLVEPQRGLGELQAWRGLLESEGARQNVLLGGAGWEDSGDPYATLVAEVVMAPIRSAITQWEPRQPEPLLAWFDAWSPLLPRGACQTLLHSLVMPRIAAAVEAWDPTRETQPIHAWLHPWLPYLAPEMAAVYPTIRHRLSRALTAWHASDGSARILLAPWSKVFEPQDWEGLMSRCILPKLAHAMQTEMVLNPLAPQLEPFDWALSWHGLLPLGQLAALMESAFFPAWLALLHHWLSHSPDYDEVTRWYLEWKGRFPQDLLDHPRVRAGFSQALNMMNSAADGQPLPHPAAAAAGAGGAAAAGAAAAGSLPSWRMEMEPDAAAGAGVRKPSSSAAAAAGAPEPSFRDLVGQYAQEQGLEFLPRAGRLHDGLPVYSFGGVSCVVDASRGVIRAQLKDRGWVPVSLERLKQEAYAKAGIGGS